MGEEQKVVFGNSVESLFRAFGPPWDPRTLVALKTVGVDPERPVQAGYPLEQYMQILAAIVRVHFTQGTEDERYFEMGRAFIRGFERTLMGRTQLAVLKIIGPTRTLQRLTRSFRAANNYSAAELRSVGTNQYEVAIAFVQQPGFYRGVLDAGLRAVGAAELQVELTRREGMQAVYTLRWR